MYCQRQSTQAIRIRQQGRLDRTTHLSSDGVAFYRTSKSGENIKNSDLENALITLSAGKLTFKEIVNILKARNLLETKNALDQIFSIDRIFDDDLSVIWKKV
jgi:hypothetical protein